MSKDKKKLGVKAIFGLVAGLALLVGMCGLCSQDVLDLFNVSPPKLPEVEASISGTTLADYTGELSETKAVWAKDAEASSEKLGGYSEEYAKGAATGAPDVYPKLEDSPLAWSPAPRNVRQTLSGEQWLTLTFPPTSTTRLLIVESFDPGSIVRIDDVSGTPTELWSGEAKAPGLEGRILEVTLPEARKITKVRINFDVRNIDGRPQIDAVGLVPAP